MSQARSDCGRAIGAAPPSRHRRDAQVSGDVVRIGVINDMSGLYSDLGGEGSVAAATARGRGFRPIVLGKKIELSPPIIRTSRTSRSAIVRRWIDENGVDAIADGGNSATALAIQASPARRSASS